MSMRIAIDDTGMELAIAVSASGGYTPDVMHDLHARAIEAYRQAVALKMAAADLADDLEP